MKKQQKEKKKITPDSPFHILIHGLIFVFVGFPMNVVAILPYLVYHYFNPPQSCRDAADHIAQVIITPTHPSPVYGT